MELRELYNGQIISFKEFEEIYYELQVAYNRIAAHRLKRDSVTKQLLIGLGFADLLQRKKYLLNGNYSFYKIENLEQGPGYTNDDAPRTKPSKLFFVRTGNRHDLIPLTKKKKPLVKEVKQESSFTNDFTNTSPRQHKRKCVPATPPIRKKALFEHYLGCIKDELFDTKHLTFTNRKEIDKRVLRWLDKINLVFSYLIEKKANAYATYAPYEVTVKPLVPKNRWTTGTYVAINHDDGTLELMLNYKKLKNLNPLPIEKMVWMFCHEFRHKIQLHDKAIQSVINYPNWKNFNAFMQKRFKKDEDFINHIFHELNPAEIDANLFATQLTGIAFSGTVFDITDESLALLTEKKK